MEHDMKTLRLFLSLLALALLLAACGEKIEPGTSTVSRPTVTAVRLATARVVSRPLTYEAVGTVAAGTTSELAAKGMGNVERIAVREGDRVKKGDLLVALDDRQARAQLAQAEAALLEAEQALTAASSARDAARAAADLAATTLTRYEALKREESVSAQEFDEVGARNRQAQAGKDQADAMVAAATSRVNQAKAAAASAQITLADTQIVAPHPGIVTGKLVDRGDLATPGRPLIVLETTRGYRVDVVLPEEYLDRVRLQQTVEVTIPALDLTGLEGTVSTVVPAADPASRSFLIKVSLPPKTGVKSGMYARVAVPVGDGDQILIPQAAVVRRGQLTGLYVVDVEGTAHFRLIRLGRPDQDLVEVLSGIGEGDRYVVEPGPTLVDGARVEAAS
jgi:RND family efflux transporter MFP subunit